MKHLFSRLGEEGKIQRKQKNKDSNVFYPSQMRKERTKREGTNCEKCGWKVKKDEFRVTSIRFGDKEVIGAGRVDGRMEPDCIG